MYESDEGGAAGGRFQGPRKPNKNKTQPYWKFRTKRMKELQGQGKTGTEVEDIVKREWGEMNEGERKKYGGKAAPEQIPKEEFDRLVQFYDLDPADAYRRNSKGIRIWDLQIKEREKCRQLGIIKEAVAEIGMLEKSKLLNYPIIIAHASTYIRIYDDGQQESPDHTKDAIRKSIPSEFAIGVFTIKSGILETYHTFIDPGKVEPKYNGDVKTYAGEQDIPWAGWATSDQHSHYKNYSNIYARIMKFLQKYKDFDGNVRIFALEHEERELRGTLNWLASQNGLKENFTIYPLEDLVCHLSRRCSKEVLGREGVECDPYQTITGWRISKAVVHSIVKSNPEIEMRRDVQKVFYPIYLNRWEAASAFMDNLNYGFDPRFACTHHAFFANPNKSLGCPILMIRRHIFHILDLVIPNFGIIPKIGVHLPYSDRQGKSNNLVASFGQESADEDWPILPGYEPKTPPSPPEMPPFSWDVLGKEVEERYKRQGPSYPCPDYPGDERFDHRSLSNPSKKYFGGSSLSIASRTFGSSAEVRYMTQRPEIPTSESESGAESDTSSVRMEKEVQKYLIRKPFAYSAGEAQKKKIPEENEDKIVLDSTDSEIEISNGDESSNAGYATTETETEDVPEERRKLMKKKLKEMKFK